MVKIDKIEHTTCGPHPTRREHWSNFTTFCCNYVYSMQVMVKNINLRKIWTFSYLFDVNAIDVPLKLFRVHEIQ